MSDPDASSLEGRAAVVTGGTQGIGQGIATRLRSLGAHVVVSSRYPPAALESDGSPDDGPQLVFEPADVRIAADVQRVVDTCRERFGRLDVFVANAGIDIGGSLLSLAEGTWDEVIAVNLKGAFLCTQVAARAMVESPGDGGRIILISSTNAFWVESNLAPYNASKAGIVALARTAALELAPHGITVNAVGPGLIGTPMTQPLLDDEAAAAAYLEQIPLGRFGVPADVAGAVAFLASEEAGWLTGHHLIVDGGQTAGLTRGGGTINS